METPPGWDIVDGALERSYRFANFAAALVFVNAVGAAAEHANHHPDIAFGWGRATVRWTTHDAGGITAADVALARRTDELA
jgi:4a-hydroxytetrahydrobiopterin dehydratase